MNSSSTHLSEQFYPPPAFRVDTIRCQFTPSPWRREIPDNWFQKVTRHKRGGTLDASPDSIKINESVMWHDKSSGLRVGGDNYGARWFEVSLPRFLHGDNSILITTEQALLRAKEAIGKVLNLVCEFDADSPDINVTRIDLVHHLPIKLADAITAHQSSRHPKFHKLPGTWVGQSLVFDGRSRKCRMYDPVLHKTGLEGGETRFEWQLRKPGLTQDFGGIVYWNKLTMEDSYRVFRDLCLGFDCAGIPHIFSIYGFLALAVKNDWRHEGIPAVDIYLRNKKKSSAKKIFREIAILRPTLFHFRWSEVLPPTYESFKEKYPKVASESGSNLKRVE